jgi:hypothetical protein
MADSQSGGQLRAGSRHQPSRTAPCLEVEQQILIAQRAAVDPQLIESWRSPLLCVGWDRWDEQPAGATIGKPL